MARIALATISMNEMAGGLERNIAYLANYLAENGHEVILITFDLPGAKSFYALNEAIIWHCVGRTEPHGYISFKDRQRLIMRMRNVLRKPEPCDVMICFQHGILARCLLASVLLSTRVICSERNALTMYDYISARKWNTNFFLMFCVHRISVQFPSYKADYPLLLQRKIFAVHNPVFPSPKSEKPREKLVLSVGRHCAQKRFDLLIRASAIAFKDHPDWRLAIIGDGSLTSELLAEIDNAGMADHIELVPPNDNLYSWFERATLYCQPSQWEGFPNGQAEAMAAGVVPVGFAETRGVADLIEDGLSGYLCDEEATDENLARCLSLAIEDHANHDRLSQEARKISKIYSPQSWGQKWANILARDDRFGI